VELARYCGNAFVDAILKLPLCTRAMTQRRYTASRLGAVPGAGGNHPSDHCSAAAANSATC
jgi:hypothetical protein